MPRLIRFIVIGCSLGLGACGGGGLNTSHTSPLTHRPDSDAVAFTEGQYETDIDTLSALMPKVFVEMGWGLGAISNQVTTLRATGITHNDRPVEVRAQQIEVNQVEVQVVVGRFPDEAIQKAFHAALAARLEAIKP